MWASRLVGLSLAIVVGAGATAAVAADIDTPSRIELNYKKATRKMVGRVSTPTATGEIAKLCRRGRVVKLIKVVDGRKRVIKKTTTRRLGRYSFRVRKPGRYQTKVVRKAAAPLYADLVSCTEDQSKIVQVRKRTQR